MGFKIIVGFFVGLRFENLGYKKSLSGVIIKRRNGKDKAHKKANQKLRKKKFFMFSCSLFMFFS